MQEAEDFEGPELLEQFVYIIQKAMVAFVMKQYGLTSGTITVTMERVASSRHCQDLLLFCGTWCLRYCGLIPGHATSTCTDDVVLPGCPVFRPRYAGFEGDTDRRGVVRKPCAPAVALRRLAVASLTWRAISLGEAQTRKRGSVVMNEEEDLFAGWLMLQKEV